MLFGKIDDMLGRVSRGVEKARDFLFSQQHSDGYWCGELEADTTLESDYIAIHTLLGTGDRERMERAVPEILRHQNEDGGWPIYRRRPFQRQRFRESVLCPEDHGSHAGPAGAERARKKILELGGVTECNTFTKTLSLLPRAV